MVLIDQSRSGPTQTHGLPESERIRTVKQTAMMTRLTVFVGAVLVAVGLMAVERTTPVQAAFPGVNGKIAYTRGWEIYVIDPTTGVKTNLTNNSVLDVIPAFSADGSKIAFTSNRGGNYDIWVIDADGSNPTNLTSNSDATDTEPAFSPDGSKIAFVSHRGGDSAIYVMNAADGSSPTRLTTNLDGNDPVFSPDGTKIAFESADTPVLGIPTREIYVMDAVDSDGDGNGDNQINLTDNSVTDVDPDFSPDGTKIAFASNRDSYYNYDIWVMDADGSDATRLTSSVARDFNPAFSPDGTKIAFDNDTDGNNVGDNYEVWMMNADGSNQTNLTKDSPGTGGSDDNPDWGVEKVDATPPDTTIDSGPSGYVKSTSASFSFSSSEADSNFKSRLDGSTFATCTSPQSYSSLSQGGHTFRVKAIDKDANVDASPASRSWFVDTKIPTGTISINGGASSTSSRSVTLKLSASDPSPASGVSSMRFRNGVTSTWSSWSAYSTSKSWTLTTGGGKKTVYVQYRDRARNISATVSDMINFNL